MKRSEINEAVRSSTKCFQQNGWKLPPQPRWDITDFGLGNFTAYGLTLINLAEEKEYCEKLMYARYKQITPAHTHKKKKEDIICRNGVLAIQLWDSHPEQGQHNSKIDIKINGVFQKIKSGEIVTLQSGERITLTPGIYHEFYPESEECIIGEVSTHNDDNADNYFANPEVGRFSEIDEDEPALVKLVSD